MTSIHDFSPAYYITTLTVAPYDNGPVIERGLHEFIDSELYARTDAPVMLRLGLDGEPYFEPDVEGAIPSDHLGIPSEWLSEDVQSTAYVERDVFICKPSQSYLLNERNSVVSRIGDGDE